MSNHEQAAAAPLAAVIRALLGLQGAAAVQELTDKVTADSDQVDWLNTAAAAAASVPALLL